MPIWMGSKRRTELRTSSLKPIVIGLSMHCSDTLQEVMRAAGAATCASKDAAADQLAQAIHTAKWLSNEIKATRSIYDRDLSGCISSLFFGCRACKRHSLQSGVQRILRDWWSDCVSVSRNARRYLRTCRKKTQAASLRPFTTSVHSAVVSDQALTLRGFLEPRQRKLWPTSFAWPVPYNPYIEIGRARTPSWPPIKFHIHACPREATARALLSCSSPSVLYQSRRFPWNTYRSGPPCGRVSSWG
jgi:hypothetical protein